MLVVDKLLISGIGWVLRRVADAVERELDDADVLREELLAAQMELELGEITEEEFAEIEAAVMARLRELKGGGGSLSFSEAEGDVDIEVSADLERDERDR